LTNLDDASAALDAGADYLGFVLYEGSPRGVSVKALMRILDRLDRPVRAVGVFVNEARGEVERIVSEAGLHAAQLHGDEAPVDFSDLAVPVWRAIRLSGQECEPWPEQWPAERYVVDASVPGMYGGTGVTADWQAAARLAAERPVMLAGGLTPRNVASAVQTVRPRGVDVAGGVEKRPGRKDPNKLRDFIVNAKESR